MASAERVTVDELLANVGWVRGIARRLLGDEHAAEDVVQDTWLAALKTGPRDPSKLGAWLGSVVRNKARSRLRTARRRRHEPLSNPEGKGPAPDELLERVETQRWLAEAILSLEEPYREAVILRFFEDCSSADIAARMGVPPSTARTRVHRGLERLRGKLDQHFGDRKAWRAALLPLAALADRGATKAAIVGSSAGLGVKLSYSTGVLVLLLAGLTLWIWTSASESDGGEREIGATNDAVGVEPDASLEDPGTTELADAAHDVASELDLEAASSTPDFVDAPDALPEGITRISGRVWVRGGGSLAGHRVFVWGGDQPGDTVQRDGSFLIDSPHVWDTTSLFLEHYGARICLHRARTSVGKVNRVEVEVDPGESLDVRVVDSEGQPLPDTTIVLRRRENRWDQAGSVFASTDLMGRLRVDFLPRDFYQLEANHPDYTYHERRIEVPADGEVVVSLVPARPLEVTLENYARYAHLGRGRVSVELRRDLEGLSADRGWIEQIHYSFHPDATGEGTVNAPPAGVWRVEVYGVSEFPRTHKMLRVEEGDGPLEIQLALEEPASTGLFSGQVLDSTDEPVAGMNVQVGTKKDETDVDGRYELHGVEAGTRHVYATYASGRARVTYRFPEINVPDSASHEFDLVLDGMQSLHVEFRGFPQESLEREARVDIRPGSPSSMVDMFVRLNGESRLTVPHLAVGEYRVSLSLEEATFPVRWVTLAADDQENPPVVIEYQEPREVRFTVEVPEGFSPRKRLTLNSPPRPRPGDFATPEEWRVAHDRRRAGTHVHKYMPLDVDRGFTCHLVDGVYDVELSVMGLPSVFMELHVPEDTLDTVHVVFTQESL